MAPTNSDNTSSSVSYLMPSSDYQTPNLPWDVFLSFRGSDTRSTFVSHLYDKLIGHGIRTFKDKPELPIGAEISEELSEAIKDSKTYVVVFSENYAASSWCLDELVEIYGCHQTMDRLIISVYYNIDPSTVRYQKKGFEEDFQKHSCRYAGDKVMKWRLTLREVAGLSGVPAERDEAEIVNEIVDRIVLELKPKTLEVAKYPTGLESRVEEVAALLSSVTDGIIKIGVYGMGGLGKTTLAKALYNHLLARRFKGSCFLANVRKASAIENGLVALQQQLIDSVIKSKTKFEVHNVEDGVTIIRERICSAKFKVLVVIDDIDDLNQYESLVGPFASGSVVIITTRDQEILDRIVVPKYQCNVNVLNAADSLELFTRHAFGNAKPNKSFMEYTDVILRHAGGLPLALEVFGSNLFNQSEDGWKWFIDKLKVFSIDDVEKKLMISFDALVMVHPVLPEIFLDIACFFIGWKKETVVKIMKTCYAHSSHNIDILKKRCLLTVSDEGELGMHDLLQDMGKKIARNNSPEEPGKYSRLCVLEDIFNVLKNYKGTEAIRGIIPRTFYHQDVLEGASFDTKTFKMMSKLRFLCLKNVTLGGGFEHIFENLTWFRWEGCPLECLPSDFCPQNLVVLALCSSKLRTMWELNMGPQVFEKLTTLDMSYSLDLAVTPNFTKLPCLETLDLKGCNSLEEVHISIGSLVRLLSLNISGCVSLRSLPDTICNLRKLNSLNIGGCSSLEALPLELGNIDSLTELNAWGLTVPKLPDSIRLLKKLVLLNLSDVGYLETPSSSASYSTLTRWEVFLSFHGPDTRYNFISHLDAALHSHGIRTFRGDPELSIGQVISDALVEIIQESMTYIVVLSENYASSSCCLDELVEILSCCKSTGRLLIPVFCNIDASVLRNQTGGFEKLKIRLEGEMEKLNDWRNALTELSNFPGYQVSGYRESETISQVIDRVLLEINSRTLHVARYPVRLKYRVESIITSLSSGTQGVIMIGLYGMGGVGKTTLAKALFNQLLAGGSFKGSCCLSNVRDISGTLHGLVSLQQNLLSDVLKRRKVVEVHNVEEGTKLIRERICSAKILVLIDDIDDLTQYESLVGPFASGSVVIITTRDEDILDNIEVKTKYQYRVNELNDAESLALFNKHAFKDAKADSALIELSKDYLRHAGGLPLALAVFGSLLYMRSKVGWKSYLEKLKQIPDSSISQVLALSMKSLVLVDPVLEDIFLDIACFFIGQKKEEVVKIMETYYSYVDHSIDILKKRCLLTINDRNELEMHDLLRDMGRNIASNDSRGEPEKYSRLWASDDILDVLERHKGTKSINGIIPHNLCYQNLLEGKSLSVKTFRRMSKLRFLYLEDVNFTGSFKQAFKELRFLHWKCCPLKYLPSDFYPEELVILELPHSKITTMWEVNMVSHAFKKLKTLNMKYSQDLTTTPDFTKLPYLETLNLEGCEGLEELHISIGSLVRLLSLNLRGCVKLRSLPNTICNLEALEVLSIDGCSSLEAMPMELGNIESIKELHANALTVIKLPDSIGCLSKLIELKLSCNEFLETLPDTICNLSSLVDLDLRECRHLIMIAELPSNLKWIRAAGCMYLKRLPNLCNMKQLEILDLKHCSHLKEIQGSEELTSLAELHLAGCDTSLQAYSLTRRLFQVYSDSGHQIKIYITATEFPDWISDLPGWIDQSREYGSTMSLEWQPNVPPNYLSMVLCFKQLGFITVGEAAYSIENTTTGFVCSGSIENNYPEALIIIIPRSIFSIRDGDKIKLTATSVIHGIHFLCKLGEHDSVTNRMVSSFFNIVDKILNI